MGVLMQYPLNYRTLERLILLYISFETIDYRLFHRMRNQGHFRETFQFNPLQFKTCLNCLSSCNLSNDSTSICEVCITLENISLYFLVTYNLPLSLLDYQHQPFGYSSLWPGASSFCLRVIFPSSCITIHSHVTSSLVLVTFSCF